MDATARIKNLSIALEALSRINTGGSHDLFQRIEDLLKDEILEQERKTGLSPPARPANTSTFANPDDDDEL